MFCNLGELAYGDSVGWLISVRDPFLKGESVFESRTLSTELPSANGGLALLWYGSEWRIDAG